MARLYVDENGQWISEDEHNALVSQRASAAPKFEDWLKQNNGEQIVRDPSMDFASMLSNAVANNPYQQQVANNGGMVSFSTGPNQLWWMDPLGQQVYRSQEIQTGTPWGAEPSNDFLSGKDGWRDAATIAAMAAPVWGGALLGGAGAASGGVGQGVAGTAGFEAAAAGGLGAELGGIGAVGADMSAGGGGTSAMSGGPMDTSGFGSMFDGGGMGLQGGAPIDMSGFGGSFDAAGMAGMENLSLGAAAAGGAAGGTLGTLGAAGGVASGAAGVGSMFDAEGMGEDTSGGAMDQSGSYNSPTSQETIFGGDAENPGGSFGMQDLINQIFGGGDGMSGVGGTGGLTQGNYQFPYANALGGLLEMYGRQQQTNTLQSMMQQAIDSDLWRGQQSRYFEPLNQAATQGLGNTAYGQSIANQAAAKQASMGYNMSGNQMHAVAQGLNKGTLDYINAVGPLATGRGGQANAIAGMGSQIANAQQGMYGAAGNLFGNIAQGQQPSLGQQIQGQQPNKSLIDVFKSVSL